MDQFCKDSIVLFLTLRAIVCAALGQSDLFNRRDSTHLAALLVEHNKVLNTFTFITVHISVPTLKGGSTRFCGP